MLDAGYFFTNIFQKFAEEWQTPPPDFKIFGKGSLDADIALEGETVKKNTIKAGNGRTLTNDQIYIPIDTVITVIGRTGLDLIVNIYQWGDGVIIPKDLVYK